MTKTMLIDLKLATLIMSSYICMYIHACNYVQETKHLSQLTNKLKYIIISCTLTSAKLLMEYKYLGYAPTE